MTAVKVAEYSKAYGTEIRVDSDSMRAYLEIPE